MGTSEYIFRLRIFDENRGKVGIRLLVTEGVRDVVEDLRIVGKG